MKPRLADALAFFDSLGVTEVRVLAALDVAKADDVQWVHIDRLVQFAASINTGEATVAEIFGSKPATGEKPTVEDQKGEDLSEDVPGKKKPEPTPGSPPPGEQSFGKRAEREAKAKEEAKAPKEPETPPEPKPGTTTAAVDLQF